MYFVISDLYFLNLIYHRVPQEVLNYDTEKYSEIIVDGVNNNAAQGSKENSHKIARYHCQILQSQQQSLRSRKLICFNVKHSIPLFYT